MELVIGDKAWSTWSMRPWLVLRHAGAPFTETLVKLRRGAASADEIARHSPSGLVPVLKVGDLVIGDSLAICEYLAERHPELWPADASMRALVRAATAEMHSSFQALRRECPMDLAAEPRPVVLSAEANRDVGRIVPLWRDLLDRSGGPFLGGAWSIADAFFTPVATRFRTYVTDLSAHGDEDGAAQAYADRLLATPEFLAWQAGA